VFAAFAVARFILAGKKVLWFWLRGLPKGAVNFCCKELMTNPTICILPDCEEEQEKEMVVMMRMFLIILVLIYFTLLASKLHLLVVLEFRVLELYS
jgi:hypothetical protein